MQTVAELQQRFGQRYPYYLLSILMLGSMAMILASTSINVALPAIMAVFEIGRPLAQWLATGFLASMTAGLLLSAWAMQRLGARATTLVGLGLFIFTSLLALLATSAWQLIVLRIVQGLSAGIIQPLAMVLIFRVFSHARRGTALGIFGLGVMIAPTLGPTINGYLVDAFGWQAVFWLPVPMCLLAAVAGQYLLPSERQPDTPLDLYAFGMLSMGLFAGLAALAEAQRFAWHEPRVSLPALLGSCGFLGFIWRSRVSCYPLLALHLWRQPGFRHASWVSLALGVGLYGTIYLIPLHVQSVEGYSAGQAGLLLLPTGVLMGVASFFAGRLTDHLPSSLLLFFGMSLLAVSCAGLGWLQAGASFFWLCFWACVGRVGLGVIFPALTTATLNTLAREDLSHGAAAISFMRQFGGAFGVNLLTFFLEWRFAREGGDGAAEALAFQQSYLLLAALFTLALFAAYRTRSVPHSH
jgi:EmrB/QacA subfamily drug resistance transporter